MNKYLLSLWRDIDNDVLKAIFRNFGLNASFFGYRQQQENAKKYGCNIPWAILMDPTSACNLHCTGCWAAEYGNRLNLTYEEMDSIVNQANELGCYLFLFTGGEPLVRKADIIRLCEAHPDSQFTSFTNATLIDEAFAGGCIAGGRRYLHINANSDMDPCAFIHYSDSNIREKTLLEGLQSPLFMAYHDNQPFSDNMLRPCPLLDNKGALARMVDATNAHSTDLQNPEDVHALTAKCRDAADKWQPVADELWHIPLSENEPSGEVRG